MENILILLKDLFTVNMLVIALTGAVLGMFWGAMPGLTTTMAMALLVSLTYTMSTHGMIMFLMSTMTSSVFGGSITAVLLNIPGTPAAIPTAMEGYPLHQRGEGGLALGTAIVASFLGNWIGIIVLIVSIPLVMAIVMKIGSWEVFLICFWGIAICGTLVDNSKPIKGWISGWIGLLIAMIGIDPVRGVERFTFDVPDLMDGVALIPVIIGLFGLTELLKALASPGTTVDVKPIGRIIPSYSLMLKNWLNILRSSFMGIIVGAIPVAGPNIAAFLAYIAAKQSANEKEKKIFGKGSYPGIIAAEVANNACIGGELLPTLTLGIPGSAAMVVLLGCLNLHGVRVGPALEMHHPGMIYFFFGALIISNLLMYGVALTLIRPSLKIFMMKKEILMPLILPLCVIGAYGVNRSVFDLYLMLVTGIVGFVLHKMKYPPAPLILGLILGPLADENLRKAVMIFQGQQATIIDILSRPFGTVMLLVLALTFYKGIRKS